MMRRTREKPVQPVFEKQVHTTHLTEVSKVIRRSISEHFATVSSDAVLESAVRGQCVECGHPLLGKNLVSLATNAIVEDSSSKLGRLQRGYCGSTQCRSYYYAVSFFPYSGVDWGKIVPRIDDIMRGVVVTTSQRRHNLLPELSWRPSRKTWLVAASVIVGLCALATIRQIYVGGRIPILREPAHFRVDPEPPGGLFQ